MIELDRQEIHLLDLVDKNVIDSEQCEIDGDPAWYWAMRGDRELAAVEEDLLDVLLDHGFFEFDHEVHDDGHADIRLTAHAREAMDASIKRLAAIDHATGYHDPRIGHLIWRNT